MLPLLAKLVTSFYFGINLTCVISCFKMEALLLATQLISYLDGVFADSESVP